MHQRGRRGRPSWCVVRHRAQRMHHAGAAAGGGGLELERARRSASVGEDEETVMERAAAMGPAGQPCIARVVSCGVWLSVRVGSAMFDRDLPRSARLDWHPCPCSRMPTYGGCSRAELPVHATGDRARTDPGKPGPSYLTTGIGHSPSGAQPVYNINPSTFTSICTSKVWQTILSRARISSSRHRPDG